VTMRETVEESSVADLSWEATIPASRLRKRALEQVFVTDWMRGPGDDYCTIAAQLPLTHARFSDTVTPYHDILLIGEIMMQAGLMSAWKVLGVTAEQWFLVRELRIAQEPLEANRRSPDRCDMTVAQDKSSDFKRGRLGRMVGGRLHARCAIGGRPSGYCEVIGAWAPEDVYQSLRGKRRVDPAELPPRPPDLEVELNTGKVDPRNSVITPLRASGEPRGYEATLLVDPDDPTFFDPRVDHVPGLLMLDGLQQVAVAAACRELGTDPGHLKVISMDMKFARFAELAPDVTCAIELDEDGRGGAISCHQDGKRACSGSFGLAILD
jgi:2-oxo-3-(phosphooxy)propyl 3-oxoalkanoate synthase